MKKNKVGRPRKQDIESGLKVSFKPGKALEELQKQYDYCEDRFLKTDGLDGVNEELKEKPVEKVIMIKDNALFALELDLLNKRKEELEELKEEIRIRQVKIDKLEAQIKWLETGLERWAKNEI